MLPSSYILEILNTCLSDIHTQLGLEWPAFSNELTQLGNTFATGLNYKNMLAFDEALWQVCSKYGFVKGFLLGYAKHKYRQLPAGGQYDEDDFEIHETANRFQSLLTELRKLIRPTDSTPTPDENRDRLPPTDNRDH